MAAAAARRVVSSVTDVVFPAPKFSVDAHQQRISGIGHEYNTNLPLQMMLFFNVLFYPIWLISSIITLEAKYDALSTLYRIIIIAILVVMTIVELIRLYLGYVGNLTEKVPELAGFWLLTVLLQVPLVLFLLLNEGAIILPLERAMDAILAAFVLVEVICGFVAIRVMVNYQVTRFHLQQFTDLDTVQDPHMFENPVYGKHPRYVQ